MKVAVKLALTVIAILILALVVSLVTVVANSAYAACSATENGWGWDNSLSLSCAPCDISLRSGQKHWEHCGGGTSSAGGSSAGGSHRYKGIRIKWPENKASEQVNVYRLEWSRNGGEYARVNDLETPCSDDRQCAVEMRFADYSVSPGDQMCFRVKAVRWYPAGESVWSDPACAEAESISGGEAIGGGVSKPGKPSVLFIN